MTRASERFDWDKAISLFKSSTYGMYDEPVTTITTGERAGVDDESRLTNRMRESIEELRADAYQSAVHPATPAPALRCRKDLHDMTPENTYLNVRTGHRRCRACTKIAERDRALRKPEDEHRPESWSEIGPYHQPEVFAGDLPAEQLTPDLLSQPSIQIRAEALPLFEKSPLTVQPVPKEPAGPPEDDLARYRESDSPDTRLLADIATSLRILAGRTEKLTPDSSESAFMQEIRELLLAGKKIQAIKLYREKAPVGLKEAKELVETFPEHQQWLAIAREKRG